MRRLTVIAALAAPALGLAAGTATAQSGLGPADASQSPFALPGTKAA